MGNSKSQPRTYLSEKDLCFLEANTAFKREKIIEWHNAFLHDCPEGKLEEFNDYLFNQNKLDVARINFMHHGRI